MNPSGGVRAWSPSQHRHNPRREVFAAPNRPVPPRNSPASVRGSPHVGLRFRRFLSRAFGRARHPGTGGGLAHPGLRAHGHRHRPATLHQPGRRHHRQFRELLHLVSGRRGLHPGARELLAGDYQAALALVRPPGHHAQPAKAEGFCILNNLGITALELVRRGLKRVLIVDWDLHHGNGLQKVFYESPEVFYFSSHHLHSYPHTGDWEEAGAGAGEGYTVNLCLPPGADDNDVVELYRQLLPTVVERYRPQIILVAAGFDAHREDPLSNLSMSAAGFGALGQLVADLGPGAAGRPCSWPWRAATSPPTWPNACARCSWPGRAIPPCWSAPPATGGPVGRAGPGGAPPLRRVDGLR